MRPYTTDELAAQLDAVNPIKDPHLYSAIFKDFIAAAQDERAALERANGLDVEDES